MDYNKFCDIMRRTGRWPLTKRAIFEAAYQAGFEDSAGRLDKAVADVQAEAIESVLEQCTSLGDGRSFLRDDIAEYAEMVRQGELSV